MGQIWRLCVKSYRDALTLLQQTGSTLIVALVILIGSAVLSLVTERLIGTRFGRELASTLLSVGAIWFASPYFVSLYRYLLNGETVAPAVLRGTDAADRFFGWSAVLAFVAAAPGYVFALFSREGLTPETADSPETILLVWITMALLIVVWVFTTRTITLLPAAALGEATGLRRAFAETRGRFWFIVGAVTIPTLPVVLLGFFLTAGTDGVLSTIFSLIMVPILVTLALAVTANLYRWLMDNPKK